MTALSIRQKWGLEMAQEVKFELLSMTSEPVWQHVPVIPAVGKVETGARCSSLASWLTWPNGKLQVQNIKADSCRLREIPDDDL